MTCLSVPELLGGVTEFQDRLTGTVISAILGRPLKSLDWPDTSEKLNRNVANPVEITVFDREPSWKDACQRVLACVGSGLNITLRFVSFDATDPATYVGLDFSGFHLVTANFFASEIRKAKIVGASKGFWTHLFASMGAGKIFLAVDFADALGVGWRYIDSVIPSGSTDVLADQDLGMSCPDF